MGAGVGSTGTTQNIQTTSSANGTATVVWGQLPRSPSATAGPTPAATQLTLGSSITITNSIANDNQSQTFIVGSGTNNTPAGTYYTGNTDGAGTHTSTLGQLADAINAQSSTLGVYATIGSTGLTLTTGSYVSGNYDGASPAAVVGTPTQTTGQIVGVSANSLTTSNANSQMTLYSPQVGGAVAATPNTVVFADGTSTAAATDVLTGSSLSAGPEGTATTFQMASLGGTHDYNDLATAITNAGLGISAAWSATAGGAGKGGLVLSSSVASSISITSPLVVDSTDVGTPAVAVGATVAGATGQPDATPSTAILQLTSGNIDDTNSVLGGAISLTYNGNTQTFIMGNDPGALNADHIANAIYTGGTNATSLVTAINHDYALGRLGDDLTCRRHRPGGIYLQGAPVLRAQSP